MTNSRTVVQGQDIVAEQLSWIDRELHEGVFQDARLLRRLRVLLGQFAQAPGQSIALVCQDWANTKAAYRFLSNARVSEADILAGHFDATRERIAATPEAPVLMLHDTTEFSWQRDSAQAVGVELTLFHGHLMVLKPKESEMSKYRTAYAPEFRQQLIELVHAGRSANDVAKEFGLHATTVAKWVRLSPMGMPAAVPSVKSNVPQGPLNAAERQELVELRRKLRQVQMERDILAKATAWFAGKSEKTSTTSTSS